MATSLAPRVIFRLSGAPVQARGAPGVLSFPHPPGSLCCSSWEARAVGALLAHLKVPCGALQLPRTQAQSIGPRGVGL